MSTAFSIVMVTFQNVDAAIAMMQENCVFHEVSKMNTLVSNHTHLLCRAAFLMIGIVCLKSFTLTAENGKKIGKLEVQN